MSIRGVLDTCPFCGGASLLLQQSTPDREGVPCAVLCDDCGALGPWKYVHEGTAAVCEASGGFPLEVVDLWNDRKQTCQQSEAKPKSQPNT
jgi:Restriction alleviation protein Lar